MDFMLPEEMYIKDARNIWNDFLSEIGECTNDTNKIVIIDAENLKSIDTAGLQLLIAMKNELEYRGREYCIKNVSSGLSVDMHDYGYNIGHLLNIAEDFNIQN